VEKKVDFRLERGLKFLVPIHQVGQQGQIARAQRMKAGPKNVGDLAFIHEGSHLRLAYREPAAVFNLFIPHRKAVGQNAFFRLIPLDDTNELLPQKLS
jgi:hypothetical protein